MITGASSGIGRATALRVGAAGGQVILVARGVEKLDQTKAEIEALGGVAYVHRCDLSDMSDIERMAKEVLQEHGRVDVLVNNAGRSIRRSIALSYDRFHDFERTMQLNYFGPVKLILALLPIMRQTAPDGRKGGHILNVSSIGVQTNIPRFSAYVASKAALDAFSRCIASEVIDDGVHLTTIHMPLVRTPMIAPTKMYDRFPTMTPAEAADMICKAMIRKPKKVGTTLGNIGELAYQVAPRGVDVVLNPGYKLFPDSHAARAGSEDRQTATDESVAVRAHPARRAPDQPSTESVAFAHILRGRALVARRGAHDGAQMTHGVDDDSALHDGRGGGAAAPGALGRGRRPTGATARARRPDHHPGAIPPRRCRRPPTRSRRPRFAAHQPAPPGSLNEPAQLPVQSGGQRAQQIQTPPAPDPRPEDLLVPNRSPITDQPASWGWRGTMNRGSGGLIRAKAGPDELAAREAILRIQRGFSRPMTVVVVQPKGGAGKTPTTICLSAAFGAHRGGYVVGWDDNETRGTLAVRVANPDDQRATVWDLLSDLAAFERFDARVGDLGYYVRPQPDAHFDALVSDDNPSNMAQIGEEEFQRLHRVLQRFYRMIVVDTGNNVRSPNWQAAVNAADQIVVVSTYQRDVGYSGSWVLDHLAHTGREELARNAVTVLTAADPSTDRTVRAQLLEHFGHRTRSVVEIPYDRELAHGGPIRWTGLAQPTRNAWIRAGATIADALAERDRRALAARRG